MKVSQLVIAAGGVGSRMNSELNSFNSKALIEINGVPLIHYLLTSAKEAGITDFFISVNKNNKSKIRTIADYLDLNYITQLTGSNFAQVPALFRGSLNDKFLVVCGHDFIPTKHIKTLVDKSEFYDAITTAYSNIDNSTENKKRIQREIVKGVQTFKKINLNKEFVPNNHVYVRNPYMINKNILDKVIMDDFVRTAGYFIYESWVDGGNVTSVDASMPVEFDIESEFRRTEKYIKQYLKNR